MAGDKLILGKLGLDLYQAHQAQQEEARELDQIQPCERSLQP